MPYLLIGVFNPHEQAHVCVMDNRIYSYTAHEQGYIKFTNRKVALMYARLICDNVNVTRVDEDTFTDMYPKYYKWPMLMDRHNYLSTKRRP